eukprot:2885711-Prymnesium_polylepis.1
MIRTPTRLTVPTNAKALAQPYTSPPASAESEVSGVRSAIGCGVCSSIGCGASAPYMPHSGGGRRQRGGCRHCA